MNTIEVAYRMGKRIKSLPEGLTLVQLYKNMRESLSSDAWDIIHGVIPGMHNYYAFPNAYEIIKNNNKNSNMPQRHMSHIGEILDSEHVSQFSTLCIKFAQNLDKTAIATLNPFSIPSTFGEISTPPKLRRDIQDLHTVVKRTGVFRQMIRHMDQKTHEFPSTVSEFQAMKANKHLLNRNLRQVIRQLANSSKELNAIGLNPVLWT